MSPYTMGLSICSEITDTFFSSSLPLLFSASTCLQCAHCTSSFLWMRTIVQCGRQWKCLLHLWYSWYTASLPRALSVVSLDIIYILSAPTRSIHFFMGSSLHVFCLFIYLFCISSAVCFISKFWKVHDAGFGNASVVKNIAWFTTSHNFRITYARFLLLHSGYMVIFLSALD